MKKEREQTNGQMKDADYSLFYKGSKENDEIGKVWWIAEGKKG